MSRVEIRLLTRAIAFWPCQLCVSFSLPRQQAKWCQPWQKDVTPTVKLLVAALTILYMLARKVSFKKFAPLLQQEGSMSSRIISATSLGRVANASAIMAAHPTNNNRDVVPWKTHAWKKSIKNSCSASFHAVCALYVRFCFAPFFLQKSGVLEWGWLQIGSSHFNENFSL